MTNQAKAPPFNTWGVFFVDSSNGIFPKDLTESPLQLHSPHPQQFPASFNLLDVFVMPFIGILTPS
jgi:hypothetical protein